MPQASHFNKYIRTALIFFLCTFAATFYMVEKRIALIHIQLGLIAVLTILNYGFSADRSINFKENRIVTISMIGLWLCMLLSVAINGDWLEDGFITLNNKIWLVALPIIFFIMPKLSLKEAFLIIVSYLLGILVISSLAVYKFFAIKLGYDTSLPLSSIGLIEPELIPFKLFHHTLSIYLSLGIVLAVVLVRYFKTKINKLTSAFLVVLVMVFTVYIALIGARIGFVTLLFLFLGYSFQIFIHLKWPLYQKIALIIGLIIVIGSIAYLTPNTRERIRVTMDEYKRSKEPEKNHGENISARLLAYKVAFNLLGKYPVKGVSFSKENDIYMDEYETGFGINPDSHPFPGSPLKPHTELLRYFVILGIPIGSLFIVLYFALFLVKQNKLRFDYWLYLGVFSLYMMTDFPFHLKEVFYMFCFFIPLWRHVFMLFNAGQNSEDKIVK